MLTVLALNIVGDSLVRRRRGASTDNPTGYLEPTTVSSSGESRGGAAPGSGGSAVAPLLEVSGLTVRYGETTAVDAVDLRIRHGQVLALVGESGSGKTSLAMALADLLTPPASSTAERVRLGGERPLDLVDADTSTRAAWRSRVGVVFQEPSAALNPLQTVGRQLRDVIEAQRRLAGRRDGQGMRGIDEEIVELLTAVGLRRPDEVARLRPGQISGGMAQRVMIALALAKSPELLIADEPTTALDVTVQAEIIALLRRLCQEREFGVLLVTHDLGVAGELADEVVVMLHGEVVEAGPIESVVRRPCHEYTAALVAAVPRNEPGRAILEPPRVTEEVI